MITGRILYPPECIARRPGLPPADHTLLAAATTRECVGNLTSKGAFAATPSTTVGKDRFRFRNRARADKKRSAARAGGANGAASTNAPSAIDGGQTRCRAGQATAKVCRKPIEPS